jgi:sugar phosphate isomerase/epimerase
MIFGRPLWHFDRPFDRAIRRLKKIGFDYVEISLDWPIPSSLSAKEAAALRDFQIAFHAPLDIDLTSPRREIASVSLNILRNCIDFAADFEPLYLNFHLSKKAPVHVPAISRAVRLAANRALSRLTAPFPLVIENNPYLPFGTAEEMAKVPAKFALCLDWPHAMRASIYARKKCIRLHNSLQHWARPKRLLVAHLHDIKLPDRDHLPAGRGDVDFKTLARVVRGCRFVLIESFKDRAPRQPAWLGAELRFFRTLLRSSR